MSEKKVGKRLLTWVLVLVMTLSLLPLNVLAAGDPETDSSSGMIFTKELAPNQPDDDGNYTIRMTAQATGKTTTTTEAVPMDIVLVLDQSGSMKDKFDNDTRQSAMKEAVISFIDEVADKNADHRMAIVTFSDDAKTLAGWTAVNSTGAAALTNAISNLPKNPSGATNVGEGMETARTLMNNSEAGAGRLKTVIVFTDGVPTTASDFSTTVANTAIDAAKGMKAAGVTVYTVGIFNGADPDEMYGASGFDTNSDGTVNSEWAEDNWGLFPSTDFPKADRPAGNRFLNLVSSNYPNADSIGLKRETSGLGILHSGISYTITKNFNRVAKGNYYLTAVDASELNSIFKTISDTIVEPDNPELNGDTVITDTLSDYFTFAGTAEDVKVYAEKRDGTTYPITDGIDVKGKTVTVTGYDFSAHYKGIGNAEETLFIEIKVKPDPTATWRASDDYETNEGNATVTLPNIEKPIAEAASPKVHVDTYKVTYQPGTGTGNEYTDQYYLNGAKTPVKANTFTAPDGYEFDCWKDDNDTTYQVGADITFDKSNVTLTAQWKEIEAPTPTLVTLTANSMTVTYDGQPHNGSPYSYEALGLLPDHTVESVDYTCEPQTNVGEYDIELDNAKIVDADGNDVTDLYQITYNYGKLTITRLDVTVTIKGNTGTYEYDGTEKTVEGYTANINNDLYTEADFKLVDSQAKIRATVPGTYQMGLKPENFENTNPNFNVTFVVKPDGKLTIENRPITITANDVTGKYDGQPHGENGYSITAGSLVDGHAATVTISGSKTDAGEYEDLLVPSVTKIVDAKNKDVTGYYDISYEDGTLTINKRSVTLTSETASKVYDGTPLTKPEVTVTGDGFVEGEGATYNVTGSQTDVGKSDNEFTYELNANTKASNYNITMYKGELVITAADSVAYKVEHYKQNLDGSYNDTPNDIDPLSGTAGTLTAAAAKDYPGFTPGTVTQEKIKSDGTTTVKIQYTRNSYTLTINYVYRDGSKAAESHIETILYGKDYSVTSPKISGYTADKLVVSGTMPADNRTVTVTYTKNGGHHPRPKPTVTIEDDDALGLNTTDHFAYIVGYGNGEVRPQNNITRAEVATIFFRLLTDDVRDENLTKTNRYSDVTRADWYNTAVSTLSSMGIITGYPDGTFRPNAAITRAEFAAIAARFDSNGDKTTAKFSDIATHWAKDEISIAYNNGWINGYPDGTFGPQRDITRAETMTLVNRVLNRQPETENDLLPNMVTWTDNANPNAWYYLAVQEATNSHYYKFKTNSKYEKWTELRETRDWTQLEK